MATQIVHAAVLNRERRAPDTIHFSGARTPYRPAGSPQAGPSGRLGTEYLTYETTIQRIFILLHPFFQEAIRE